jgi:hypothetical protein
MRFNIKILIAASLFLILMGLGPVHAGDAASAVIWTDKPDYSPGETVTIYGSRFLGSTTVTVSVTRPDGTVDSWKNVITDPLGSFTTSYQLDGIFGTYTVTATDGTNTATTTFTDAVNLHIKGTDGNDHESYDQRQNLGTFTQGTSVDADHLHLSATGIPSGKSVAWTVAYVAGYEQDDTLDDFTTFTPSPPTGTFTPGDTATLRLVITTDSLAAGTYVGQLKITGSWITGSETINSDKYYFTFTVTGPHVHATWSNVECCRIKADAHLLSSTKNYYVTYADPDGNVQGTSTTYTGVTSFTDYFLLDITLPRVLGTWTVKLYESPATLKDSDTVDIDRMVWTTDSTYSTMKTSFAQGETVYFKAIGLQTSSSYKFRLDPPSGPSIWTPSDWQTGVSQLTGSYTLSGTDPIGQWKLHVRRQVCFMGFCWDEHYVDTCDFTVVTGGYTVTFTESGLPSGTSWSVTFNGVPYSSTTNTITITNIAAGNYPWTVSTPISGGTGIQYVASPSSGTMNVPSQLSQSITYTTQYLLTVKTNGLPSPYTSAVYVGGSATTDDYGVSSINDASPDGWRKWFDASTGTIGVDSPVAGATGTRYLFKDWSDASTVNPHASLTLTGPLTLTANYKTQYLVTFYQSGVGSDFTGTVATIDGGNYGGSDLAAGVEIWVDSSGSIYFEFKSPLAVDSKQYIWAETTGLSDKQSDTITVSDSGSVSGHYLSAAAGITVTSSPVLGDGYVIVDDNPVTTPHSPSPPWIVGSTHNITANEFADEVPGQSRYRFDHWSDDQARSHIITVDLVTTTYTASFVKQSYLDIGTEPPGLPLPTDCQAGWYDDGTTLTCTAQTVPGYTFSHWVVDGEPQPPGVISFTLTVGSKHTAIAIYFSGGPGAPPVGGYLTPVNKLVILSPYLILLGLIGAVLMPVAAKRRRNP